MSVRSTSFRTCMLIGALALLGAAVFYGFGYIGVSSVIRTANFTPFYAESIRSLWIGYCLQSALLGVLFIVAAVRPYWISRPLVVICGLMPLAQAVLALSSTGNVVAMVLMSIAAVFVLLGSVLWPARPAIVAAPAKPGNSPPPPLPPTEML
jgi:hypothetical protein